MATQPACVVLAKIESFLLKYKAACLSFYEDKVWAEVHNYGNYASDRYETDGVIDDDHERKALGEEKKMVITQLANLRRKIYVKIRSRQSVTKVMKKYRFLTDEFIKKFEAELSEKRSRSLETGL